MKSQILIGKYLELYNSKQYENNFFKYCKHGIVFICIWIRYEKKNSTRFNS